VRSVARPCHSRNHHFPWRRNRVVRATAITATADAIFTMMLFQLLRLYALPISNSEALPLHLVGIVLLLNQ
jgi:hypothetical protein